jgi:AraC-like DNA-binding protein
VSVLQEKMSISREHLYRKLKALTGDSPSGLIRSMRLKTAASLIEKGEKNITEISLNVGFSNSSSFAHSFKTYFGKSPQEYKREMAKGPKVLK